MHVKKFTTEEYKNVSWKFCLKKNPISQSWQKSWGCIKKIAHHTTKSIRNQIAEYLHIIVLQRRKDEQDTNCRFIFHKGNSRWLLGEGEEMKRMWIHLEWWGGWKGKEIQYFNIGVLGFNKLLSVKIKNVLCYLSLCGAFGSNFGIFAAVIRTYHEGHWNKCKLTDVLTIFQKWNYFLSLFPVLFYKFFL